VLDAQNAWFGAVRTEQIDRRHEREQSFWDEAIRSVIDGGAAMPDRTRSARPNPNDDRSAAWRSSWDRHDDAMIPCRHGSWRSARSTRSGSRESEAAKKTGNTEQAGDSAPHKESGERHW